MPYYRLFHHFVWATKDRLPLITDANREPIYATIRAKTTELHGIVHALNGMDDHIHLIVTVPPSASLSTFVGQVKDVSSHLANQISSAAFAWQGEYGAVSVSESHLPRVIRYVAMQQQHHTAGTLDPRFEQCESE